MELTWDNEVTLLGADGYEKDALGQKVPKEKRTTVFCSRMPISRQEFYMAGQNDIEVSEILVVHPYEYNNENYVEFDGRKLKVLKTYHKSLEELQLTCIERLGDKSG